MMKDRDFHDDFRSRVSAELPSTREASTFDEQPPGNVVTCPGTVLPGKNILLVLSRWYLGYILLHMDS